MRRFLVIGAASVFSIATLAVQPSVAGQQVAPAEPEQAFEVVRLGDGAMTCEALIAEIRDHNTELQAMQQRMSDAGAAMSQSAMRAVSRPGGSGMGMVTGLGGIAAGFVPGGSMVMGAVQAAGAMSAQASMRNQQQQMSEQMAAMTAGTARMGPLSQRIDHLSEISRSKSC